MPGNPIVEFVAIPLCAGALDGKHRLGYSVVAGRSSFLAAKLSGTPALELSAVDRTDLLMAVHRKPCKRLAVLVS